MIEYQILINKQDVTNMVTFPINITELLDTGLDSGSIQLWNTNIEKPFEPFSLVEILCNSGEDTKPYYYYVAVDNREINNFGENNTYTHNISLIEPTKLLERRTVDNLTVTQNKFGFVDPIIPTSEGDDIIINDILRITYFIPSQNPIGSSITIPSLYGSNDRYGDFVLFKNPDSRTYPGGTSCSVESNFGANTFNQKVTLTQTGSYYLKITLGFGSLNGASTYTLVLTYNFTVTDENLEKQKSISSELQRIVDVTPLQRLINPYYELQVQNVSSGGSLIENFLRNLYGNYDFNSETGVITGVNPITESSQLEIGKLYYFIYSSAGSYFMYQYELTELLPSSSDIQRVRYIETDYKTQLIEQKNEFVIDPQILQRYNNTRCPEFNFTKMTLWEALLQVGEYIHAIPRLTHDNLFNFNTITFDFLGLQKNATLFNEIYNKSSNDMEQYCTELDSYVDNLINTETEGKASIVEPGKGLFKTVTTDDGFLVTNDNCKIILDYPIYELKKVLIRDSYTGDSVDITKYCYESNEYRLLYEYGGYFPYSKAFALKYSIGENTISQFQYKTPVIQEGIESKMAIVNIMEYEGYSINPLDINNLQYQVEYIPLTSSRVKQLKTNNETYIQKSTLYYNQSANMVDSVAYGENLKGTVLRLSNEEISKTFRVKNVTQLPKIGDVVGNYYIVQINCQYYAEYINCTIQLSKDFNRLSKYIGISSFNRMYEVSERQTVERSINYGANIEISINNGVNNGDVNSIITNEAKQKIIDTFVSNSNSNIPSLMLVTTYKKDKTLIKTLAFPLNTIVIGNSIVFSSKFLDNYSAGMNIGKQATGGGFINSLNYIPYNNEFGEFEYLSFNICSPSNVNNIDSLSNELPDASKLSVTNELIKSNNSYRNILSNPTGALQVKKGNREIPKISIQLNYTTNNDDIIIGYYLTHTSGFINQSNKNVGVYLMDKKINKFDKIVAGGRLIKTLSQLDFDLDSSNPRFNLKSITIPPYAYQSIAIKDDNDNLLIGINKNNLDVLSLQFVCK